MEGEQLDGIGGLVTVERRRTLPGTHRVYNLTVQGEHLYRVATSGVLVHNNGCGRVANVSELYGRQLKSEFSGNKIKRFRRAMKEQGGYGDFPAIQIVVVDGRKIIVDGHHRARAAGAAGIKEVPVEIVDVIPEVARRYLQEAAEAAESFGLPF